MRKDLKVVSLIIGWCLLVGLILPWLFSAPSDIAVGIGFFVLISALYFTYRVLWAHFEKGVNDVE